MENETLDLETIQDLFREGREEIENYCGDDIISDRITVVGIDSIEDYRGIATL